MDTCLFKDKNLFRLRKCYLLLLTVVFLLAACGVETETVKQRVKDSVKETQNSLAELRKDYRDYKKKTAEELKRLEAVNDTLEETKETVEDAKEVAHEAKEVAHETKEKVDKTAAKTKRTVLKVARRMPRSQQEANQMVVENGRGFLDWLRSGFDEYMRQHPDGLYGERRKRQKKSRS